MGGARTESGAASTRRSNVEVYGGSSCRNGLSSGARRGTHPTLSRELSHADGGDQRHQSQCTDRRTGACGCAVAWLWRYGRHVGAARAAVLAKDHTVIVPDLRGMGLSAHPDTGYTKKNQAVDIAGVMDALKIQKADLVTHDIGNMVGYALAAQYPARITRWVAIDAPLPGIGDWDNIIRSPALWHFNFRGPDVERLVQGVSGSIWTGSGMNFRPIPKGSTRRLGSTMPHSMPGRMRCTMPSNSSAPSPRTPSTTRRCWRRAARSTMPVLAIGAEKSFGTAMADDLRFVASNVTGGIVPKSGHWIMEENPQATIPLVTEFLAK